MNSPFQTSNLNFVELLLFEVIERIAIFHLHLKETDTRFFPPRPSNSSEPHLVDSFNECLSKMLHCAAAIVESSQTADHGHEQQPETIQQIGGVISAIKELHRSNLGHLPRPPESPELKRFGRILQKYVVTLREPSKSDASSAISIYLGETETTYAGDPLLEYKLKTLNNIINKANLRIGNRESGPMDLFAEPSHENLGYHLTVPRIDATNPCRWPTLVHEVGHRIMDQSFFKHGDIKTDFEEFLSNDSISFTNDTRIRFDLKHWLTECWCDLFGAIVIGPSFWFAQWSSFLFNFADEGIFTGTETHPPALFRLHLILKVLSHRFPDALSSEFNRIAFAAKKLLEEFDIRHKSGFIGDRGLRQLVLLFQDYFFGHFFTKREDGELVLGENALNDKLTPLIKYTKGIEKCVIDSMVKSLSNGLPIPSFPILDPTTWRERPSTVQEILLSAWIYRNTTFRNDVLAKYHDIIDRHRNNPSKIWEEYVDEVVKMFNAFNFSLLRSIQVSEWFHLFEGAEQGLSEAILSKAEGQKETDKIPSVLSDYQIFDLVRSREIKVIPIMSLEKQLGATSLDIRLGTSFQVYSPNQVGIVDLTNNESVVNANTNSTLVDLDFLESI